MRKLLATAVLGVMGCGGGGDGNPLDPDAADPYRTVIELPVTVNRNIDILFVVDDSSSTADKQASLAANLPTFIDVLATAPGGLPDVHIGVVTSDMGTRASDGTTAPAIGTPGQGGCTGTGKGGNLQTTGAPVMGTFISDILQTDSSRVRNYTGNLVDVFATMVRVGSTGCGFEQPLAAMRAALDNNPANAGFLRPDATLAVVFVADEDDCSIKARNIFEPESPTLGPLTSFRCTRFGVTCSTGGTTPDEMNQVGTKSGCGANPSSAYVDDIAPYVAFLNGLKPERGTLIVATIAGAPTPVATELRSPPGGGAGQPALAHSCAYQNAAGPEVADPPVRLTAFARAFDRSAVESICEQDLSQELASIATLVSSAAGSPCLGIALADTNASEPGTQPDCIAEDLLGTEATTIPACGASIMPTCWRLVEDPQACVAGARQRLQVERSGSPDPGVVTRLRCRL